MSIYFSDADDNEVFGASNTGWGDVRRFVEDAAEKLPFMAHLALKGWVSPPSALRPEIAKALGFAGVSKDVRGVLETLSAFAKTADEIVLIGDGLVSEETPETKSAPAVDVTKPQPYEPWTDEQLNEMTEQFTPADVKESLALRGAEMREILTARDDDE